MQEQYIKMSYFLPVQTLSNCGVQAADWKNPDGHGPEQTTVTI